MENVRLNNGLEIPIVGSGTNTFGKENNKYDGALRGDSLEADLAIENGYRHFDSAQAYYNEEVVGQAISKSDLAREEFFITTKLNTFAGYHGVDWAHEEIKKSLEKLETEYVDLFLIHTPWDNKEEILEAWTILEEYYEKGVFKAIGVSNFTREDLDIILDGGKVKPVVNQIESHLGHWNDDLIDYHNDNDIKTIAWSPLKGNTDSTRKLLNEIGHKYDKTFAQVILRYQIERGVIVIPKSHDKNHQAQSIDIFDFNLSQDDRKQISNL